MTKIGLEHIADSIINRIVEVPDDLALRDLTAWLNGYAKCQNDILEMIGKYMEDDERNDSDQSGWDPLWDGRITCVTVTEKDDEDR